MSLRAGRRKGISELVAAVITIAITLIAGAAIFGYVNGQAANSENGIGVANAQNVNFLNEKFVIVDLAVTSGGNTANIWIYNNGNLALQLSQIALYQSNKGTFYSVFNNIAGGGNSGCHSPAGNGTAASTPSNTVFTFGPSGTAIYNGTSPYEITLTLPPNCTFAPGTTYYARVVGVYGNVVVYPECDSSSGCTT